MIASRSLGGVAVASPLFLAYERRAPRADARSSTCSRDATSRSATSRRSTMYAGIAILFFYLTIYLQEVAGYTALESGLTTVPVTIVMFALSRRFGALADRYGPRFFMGAGPLIAAAGILLLARTADETSRTSRDLLPALLVFALGLSLTVAPLTATVLADADEDGRRDRVGGQQRRRPRRRADRRLDRRASSSPARSSATRSPRTPSRCARSTRDDDLRRPARGGRRDRRARDPNPSRRVEGGGVPGRPVRRRTRPAGRRAAWTSSRRLLDLVRRPEAGSPRRWRTGRGPSRTRRTRAVTAERANSSASSRGCGLATKIVPVEDVLAERGLPSRRRRRQRGGGESLRRRERVGEEGGLRVARVAGPPADLDLLGVPGVAGDEVR